MDAEIITTDNGYGLATEDGEYITTDGTPIPPEPPATAYVVYNLGIGVGI